MKNIKVPIVIFVVAAGLAFVLAAPRTMHAANAPVAADGCAKVDFGNGRGGYECTMPSGSAFPDSALTGAYFDLSAYPGSVYYLTLRKCSFSGSCGADMLTYNATGTVNVPYDVDLWVPAVASKANPNDWDYLVGVANGNEINLALLGITAVNSN